MKFNEFTGTIGKSVQDSAVRALAVQEILSAAPFLNIAEWFEHTGSGNVKPVKSAAIAAGVASRALGSEYDNIATPTPTYADIDLKTIGGKIRTDKGYERQNPDGLGSEHLRQVREYARGIGRKIMDLTINGDTSSVATEFNGIKEIAPSGQVFTFDTENGGAVPFGTSTANIAQQKKFLEYLDKLLTSVAGGATCLFMDAKTIARLRSIGRDFITTTTVQDAFTGATNILTHYNEIPIFNTGYKLDNTGSVIGHNETCGTSTSKCTSVYAVKFGEKVDLSFATNVGLQVESYPLDNWLVTRAEIDIGLGLMNDKAVARLSGIIIE